MFRISEKFSTIKVLITMDPSSLIPLKLYDNHEVFAISEKDTKVNIVLFIINF